MPIISVPLLDFAPDLESPTPGIIVDTEIEGVTSGGYGFVPFTNGFGNLPAMSAVSASALATACQGAALQFLTGGSYRIIAGTSAALYELAGTTVTDRSRGGGYASGGNRWRFAAYGDNLYATNKADAVQKSTGAAFANISTIPKCSFMDRVGDFLLLAGTNEATYGDQADRWWNSALGNPDDFAPSIATQCATNRLTDSPGPITASKALGDDWIIYKRAAMYRGIYQGPPDVWEFGRISDDIGTLSHESVVKVGFSHFFVGADDFYRFDGALPTPLPNNVKNWFFDRLEKDYAYKIQGYYDRYNSIIFWFYPGPIYTNENEVQGNPAVGDLSHFICVNLKNGRWGGGKARIEAMLEYVTGGMTYQDFYPPSASTTWDAVPAITYDSLLFVGGSPIMAGFDTDHMLKTFTNHAYFTGCEMTLADVGDDLTYSTLSRVLPRNYFPQVDVDGGVVLYQKKNKMYHAGRSIMGNTVTFDAGTRYNAGRYYKMASNRWHRIALQSKGQQVLTAVVNYEFEEDGEE